MTGVSIEAMARFVRAEGEPRLYSCADSVAAAMPDGSALARAHTIFAGLSAGARRRALLSPRAAARLVAMRTGCRRVDPNRSAPAWGVARTGGRESFAVRTSVGWWARSAGGLARVHASRVVLAWEVR